ncbi:MAG: cytochrome c biogenesis protein ResB [Actinomycetota bacterium]
MKPAPARLGLLGGLRFVWRQLTSMRTALLLLLLLAIAAVPGSILPQRDVDPNAVIAWQQRNPAWEEWVDRLGGFEVYSSVWFSAIYLLLFISLVGCVLPRSRRLWVSLRANPPAVPSRLNRLPVHEQWHTDLAVSQAAELVRESLRRKHFRVVTREVAHSASVEVSGERGYLREAGNLSFHLALVVVLVGVAYGHLLGWRGEAVVPEGQTFASAAISYDTLDLGPWVNSEELPPFALTVDDLRVRFETSELDRGAPRDFRADVTIRPSLDEPSARKSVAVNDPLSVSGASVLLLGNGYAPVITVRDGRGEVIYSDATVFLPEDANYRSAGVIRVSGAQPEQLGLQGVFLPTAQPGAQRPTSLFPDTIDPVLLLGVWVGDLGLTSANPPRSVYAPLNTEKMRPLVDDDGAFSASLRPGQTIQLPDGRGSVTFERVQRFAGFSVRYDPGKPWVLGGSIIALVGVTVSLFVPRRRVFVRVSADESGSDGVRTLVQVGALARQEDAGLVAEVSRLSSRFSQLKPISGDDNL